METIRFLKFFFIVCLKKETLAAMAVTPETAEWIDYREGQARVMGFGSVKLVITRLILEYLIDCCKGIKERLASLELPRSYAELYPKAVQQTIAISGDVLVMKILLSLRQYTE